MGNSNTSSSGGGGCLSFVAFIFLMRALIWGLPTPWGELHLDLFPPAIRMVKVGP